MISYIKHIAQIHKDFDGKAYDETMRYKLEMEKLNTEKTQALLEVREQCVKTNGQHIYEHGFMYDYCVNCGVAHEI